MSDKKLLDVLSNAFDPDLPKADSLDEYIDILLPRIRGWSEDLKEERFYINKPWLEFRDDDKFHEIILHFFNEGGEYLHSENGDVSSGHWRFLEKANKIMIDLHGESHLYDLAYLDGNFFVLKKHGEPERFGLPKYFVMAVESISKKLEWRDLMELLYTTARSNNQFYYIIAVVVLLLVAIIVMMSAG